LDVFFLNSTHERGVSHFPLTHTPKTGRISALSSSATLFPTYDTALFCFVVVDLMTDPLTFFWIREGPRISEHHRGTRRLKN